MASDRQSEVEVRQEIEAPPTKVWDAWTTEAGLSTWWWAGWDDTTYHVDLRVEGSYRIEAPSAGIAVTGEYLAIVNKRSLESTWIWEDADTAGPVEHVTVTFEKHGRGTRVCVNHRGVWTKPESAANLQQGWEHVLSCLATTLQPPQADGAHDPA